MTDLARHVGPSGDDADEPRRGPGLLAVVVAGLAVGPLALLAAQGGMLVLGALLGAVVAGLAAWSQRDLLGPPLADAWARVQPRPGERPWRAGPLAVLGAAVLCGLVAWQVADLGLKGIAAVVGVVGLGAALVVAWPLITDLLLTPAADLPAERRSLLGTPPGRHAAPRPAPGTGSRSGRAAVLVGTAVVAGLVAWQVADLGMKGLVAVAGGVVAAVCLAVARDRTLVVLFGAVASLTIVLHKSFSAIDAELSGGAVSIYVSTFDVMIALLYLLWIAEGTIVDDLRAASSRRILWLPLVGALFLLPSLLVADSILLAASELFRMGWMYLLFVYVAVRVRTRRHVWAVLAGLGVMATAELVVVVLQWRTGGVLGLSFLGVPTELTERTTDVRSLGRPFGTIIHPVFMGAVMGSLGLVALGVGMALRRSLLRLVVLAVVPISTLPLYLSHTRASLVAFVGAAVAMGGYGLARGYLRWRTVGRVCLVLVALIILFWGSVESKISDNFTTEHFNEEIDSRLELNDVAGQMIDDSPLVGVGLNNFELVMEPYQRYGLIFFDNPVHNLYLLYASETGVVGLVGVVLVGVGLYQMAIRLARSRDPLFGGVGLGVAGAMGFLMVEEILGFSLRQDIPLALWWILAGLVVTCTHQARAQGETLTRRRRRRPGGGAATGTGRRRTGPAVAALAPASPGSSNGSGVGGARPGGAGPTAEGSTPTVTAPGGPSLFDRAEGPAPAAAPARRPAPAATVAEPSHPSLFDRPAGGEPPATDGPGRGDDDGRVSRRHRRLRAGGVVGVLALVVALGLPGLAGAGDPVTVDDLVLTFSASSRSTGVQGVWVGDPDGVGATRITPADGRFYSWPQLAFGGTRIVYTVRDGAPGAPEAIELMDLDGSNVVRVAEYGFRVGQPKVDEAGRTIVFTAIAPWFSYNALYRLDLATGEAVNLSAVEHPLGSFHADPKLVPGQDRIVYASTDTGTTQVEMMDGDGSNVVAITDDAYSDTDPEVSPDGTTVAIASFRGEGAPGAPNDEGELDVKVQDWFIVLRDLTTGAERVLTDGEDCTVRSPLDPCEPGQSSSYQPVWTPDGRWVAMTGTLDATTNCVCLVAADGARREVLFADPDLAITWFDLDAPTTVPAGAVTTPLTRARASRLLVSQDGEGGPSLVLGSPDLMQRLPVPTPGIEPAEGAMSADRQRIVFSAPTDRLLGGGAPWPAPPAGAERREHVSFDDLDPRFAPEPRPVEEARQQVFLREADGTVRQLTDPFVEDWRDGVRAGDRRSSTDPAISPDGRFVVVTNTSTLTGESALLRIDLATGDVLNLTNGTAGMEAVDDAHARHSADGNRLAFTWTHDGSTEVHTMDAASGADVTRVTADEHFDTGPAFSPDGRFVVASSYRGTATEPLGPSGVPQQGWALVRHDLVTGEQLVLVDGVPSPALEPVWAPEGDRIAFIAPGPSTLDVWVVPADGGVARPVQVTPTINELDVDWR